MNCCSQASAPAAGSQGTTLAMLLVTVAVASCSAAMRYCSASVGDTLRAAALLLKPSRISSVGNWLASGVVVPSRSRTALLYSSRVMRRMNDGPGSTPAAPPHSALDVEPPPGAPMLPVHAPSA